MKILTSRSAILSLLLLSVMSLPIYAQGFPSFGSKSKLDISSMQDSQSAIVEKVTVALISLSKSQEKMAEALDLKEAAEIARQNAETLESGDLTGKDDMDKSLTSTLEVSEAINKKLESGETMSAESKAKFAESLPAYGIGAVAMVGAAKDSAELGKKLTESKDIMAIRKLATLVYVAKESPTIIQNFTGTTSKLIKFAKSQGIDTSELEQSTAAW